ncbi:MAG: hypothetical protein ABSC30_10855 [Acidimicrobiales bacterium]
MIVTARRGVMSSAIRRTDSPRWAGAIAGMAGAVVAAARIVVAGHRNIASFIVVGSDHVRGRIPTGVPITSGQGYDGQFYYRMALAPLNFDRTAHGIRMDTLSRFERVGYPAFAWLVAAGRSSLVPWSLVIVNVLGLACLGALGAMIARGARHHAWWGLVLPGYFGFVWVLSRDLAEIVTATFVVAGVVALRRDRFVLAGAAFSVAVLSRETGLLVIALLALERPLAATRRRVVDRRARAVAPGASTVDATGTTPHISWILPGAVFTAWQLVARLATGSWPLLTSGQKNLDVPFAGFVQGFRHYLSLLPSRAALLWFGELFVLVVVVVAAALALRTTTARLYERAAWVAYAVVAATLAPGIWLGDVGFRSLDDLYVFSCIILLSSPRRLTVPAVLVAGSWTVVAVELIRFI